VVKNFAFNLTAPFFVTYFKFVVRFFFKSPKDFDKAIRILLNINELLKLAVETLTADSLLGSVA